MSGAPGIRATTAASMGEVDVGTGRLASRYRLLGLLGSGGMGDVYEAVHVSIDRLVAVKVLRAEFGQDPRARQRLEREARIVGALECENVVEVLDFGEFEDGTPYLVMERLRGDDLKSVLKIASRLPVRRAVSIALDVCRGLEAAHRAGLVHRDLKPANLFLSRRASGEEVCKILDFGIARRGGATTSVGAGVVGTARYMAPEQIREEGDVSAATDLYAVGALLYECLSGVPVHDAASIEAVLFRVLHHDPKPLAEILPGVPEGLAAIVHRALEKEPKARFQSAAELSRALQPFASAVPPTTPGEVTDGTLGASFDVEARWSAKRRPARALPAFWVTLAALAVAAASFGAGRASRRAPPVAESAPPSLVCPAPSTVNVPPSVAPLVTSLAQSAPVVVSHAPAPVKPLSALNAAPGRRPPAPESPQSERKHSPYVDNHPYEIPASPAVGGPR